MQKRARPIHEGRAGGQRTTQETPVAAQLDDDNTIVETHDETTKRPRKPQPKNNRGRGKGTPKPTGNSLSLETTEATSNETTSVEISMGPIDESSTIIPEVVGVVDLESTTMDASSMLENLLGELSTYFLSQPKLGNIYIFYGCQLKKMK